jgi:hypothetical protein
VKSSATITSAFDSTAGTMSDAQATTKAVYFSIVKSGEIGDGLGFSVHRKKA